MTGVQTCALPISELLRWIIIEPAIWTHFPAGGGKLNAATAGRLKSYGLTPGFPDFVILFPKKIIGIELKREDGVLSAAQKSLHPRLIRAGMMVYVCRTPEQVVEWLSIEGCPMRQNLVEAMRKERKDASIASAAESGETQSQAR